MAATHAGGGHAGAGKWCGGGNASSSDDEPTPAAAVSRTDSAGLVATTDAEVRARVDAMWWAGVERDNAERERGARAA